MDILDGPYVPESERDIVDDPMEPMDSLDPPPCDPPTRKRELWLHDTLQDDERCFRTRRSFRKSKKPCMHQGHVVDVSTMIQA